MPGEGNNTINGNNTIVPNIPNPIHQQHISSIIKDQYNLDNAS